MNQTPFLSLVIPAYNEEDVVPALLEQVGAALDRIEMTYEVLVVDDGSTDRTGELLRRGMKKYAWLRVLKLEKTAARAMLSTRGSRPPKTTR